MGTYNFNKRGRRRRPAIPSPLIGYQRWARTGGFIDGPISESASRMVANMKGDASKLWSWREELNLQPVVYKTTALPLSYASPPCFSHSWR